MSVKITLKDKSVLEVENGTTVYDVAKKISEGLARNAVAGKINGETVDLRDEIYADCELSILTLKDEDGLSTLRHTVSHVLAYAVQNLYKNVKFSIGPATKDGFYYDIDFLDTTITPEMLDDIAAEMKRLISEKHEITRYYLTRDEALNYFLEKGEDYKVELVKAIPQDEKISFYKMGNFTDLCAGPHLLNIGNIKAFKLLSVTGAYFRGDSNNKMLTRIYGTAFSKQSELDEYLTMLEEAKKRDHRKLGRELNLFAFRDEAPGMPFYLPNGMILKNVLLDYWHEVHNKWDYLEISTPQIMRRTLWETSGHWDHYHDDMFTTVIDDEDFAIKPMNCPGSILVYNLEPHSYKELPLRYGELGKVHRNELSGALHGLFRVRCFTQDDAHILLAPEQIKDEVTRITKLFDEVYSLFKLPYNIELSTMPEDHIGSKEDWDIATNALADAITSVGKTYTINEGDGAFYGPKLDFHIKDSIGRTWQCGTIQLDYQLPGRFNLEYTASDGEKHTPVMIHRVVFGSIERFIGVITEHFAGAFPTWLSPEQVRILPVSDKFKDYAENVNKQLINLKIRSSCDNRPEKIGFKIRDARLKKVPYILVVGEKEMQNNTVAVRNRADGDLGEIPLNKFIETIVEEINSKRV